VKSLIPEAALDKHIAFLGATGSGKTSAAKSGVVEPALAGGERAVIIDPTGAWWGLRVGRDGKAKGFPIYIFGGDHGDYPLRARDAEILAEAFGSSTDSAIFDTSLMTVSERTAFFTDFAEALRRKNKGPLKVIIDEAHLFMPQAGAKAGGAVPAMLHAGNNLVSLGRSRGLRITLISQRPAKLHKDSLTQVQSLVAMRLLAPQDRNAISDWISDQADPVTGKGIIASLPGLKPGEAWVWSPLDNYLERVHFPLPKTFDSSRAPDRADGAGPSLTPINLDALKGRLATVEAETKANDPRALKAENARLSAELVKLRRLAISPSNEIAKSNVAEIEAARAAGWSEGYAAGQEMGIKVGTADTTKLAIDAVRAAIPDFKFIIEAEVSKAVYKRVQTPHAPKPPKSASTGALPPLARTITHAPAPVQRAQIVRPAPAGGIESPLQRIIDAIKWWEVMGAGTPSHAQVGFIAGYSHKSGTWATYLSRLRTQGLIEGRGDLALTTEGERVANLPDAPPTGEALREIVLAKVDAPLRKILLPIFAAYPDGLDHASAGEQSGYSHSSGTWATYLSRLRTLDLIEGRGELKAQGWLFP